MSYDPLETVVGFVECSECGGDVELIVWGEGIDADLECRNCGESEGYR